MRLRRWMTTIAIMALAGAGAAASCHGRRAEGDCTFGTGEAGAALSFPVSTGTDVTGFKVVVTRTGCNGETHPSYSQVFDTGLLDLQLKNKLAADGALHLFGDTFIPLEAGCYDVLSQPVQAGGAPSAICSIAGQDRVTVLDGQATEVVLVSQCNGQTDQGALDVIALLNSPPQLVTTSYPQGKWVSSCTPQQICATFKDPDGDPVELDWAQVGGPPVLSLTVLPGVNHPDGSLTQCVQIQHAGVGMVVVSVTAYDLMQDPYGPGLIRFEDFYTANGIAATSHDSMVLQAYGTSSATCPCSPIPEVCDGVDNDCNGQNDDGLTGCTCTPLDQKTCYDGPAATAGLGACHAGVAVCLPDGSGYGPCLGQVLPGPEVCGDGLDNNCDGQVDEGACSCCLCAGP